MTDNNTPTPDLQSILSTLASFAPPGSQQTPSPSAFANHEKPSTGPVQPTPPPQLKAEDPRLRPQGRSAAFTSPKPAIDPATITTWPDGLRCVTKIAAQNAQFAASIRKMMDTQRQHEMRWYRERLALKQSLGGRERASAQVGEILGSLGGTAETTAQGRVDVEDHLATFDRKVYAAQVQMETAMTAELKGLGVPFFGTDDGAVVGYGGEGDAAQAAGGRPKHSPLVTEGELRELRQRMVEHLEVLYRD